MSFNVILCIGERNEKFILCIGERNENVILCIGERNENAILSIGERNENVTFYLRSNGPKILLCIKCAFLVLYVHGGEMAY